MTEKHPGQITLRGWKAIAAHFGRDERTVMRWAEQRGLPVRRLPGGGRSSVFAVASELDAWLARPSAIEATSTPAEAVPTLQPSDTSAPSDPLRRGLAPPARYGLAAAGAALLALLLFLFAMPARHPQSTSAGDGEIRDPAAEQSYLQASYDLSQRSPASLRRAVSEFGAAIAADPSAAAAYAGLGEAYLLLREYSAYPDKEAFTRAASAASAAIALDPKLASAHRVAAVVAFWQRRDIPLARTEFQQALALAPRDALTHHWYATALAANAEYDAALRQMDEARRLDPQSSALLADYGLLLHLSGRDDKAVALLQQIMHDQPQEISAPSYLSGIALLAGDGVTYLRDAGRVAQLMDDTKAQGDLAAEAAAFRQGGMRALLDVKWRRKLGLVERTHQDYYGLAIIAGLRKDVPRAYALLRTALARGEIRAIAFRSDLAFAGMVQRPEFRELTEEQSLAG